MSDVKDNDSGNDSQAAETPKQQAAQDAPADKAAVEKKGGKGAFVFILLALAGMAALIFYSDKLTDLLPSRTHLHESATPTETSLPQAVAPKPTVSVAAKHPAIVSPPPTKPRPVRPLVSAEEVKQVLSAMQDLSNELSQLSQDQRSMRAALREQQQMNLHVRLRWIADPAARLPQMQLAWEEIALLPGLSDEQRSVAVRMHQLARADVAKLHQWRLAIRKWADTLIVPAHEDVLPQPHHPWLAWIVGQFHLRQAPSLEARKLSALREQLFDAARLLILESWPEQGEWQALRARLLLEVRSHQADAASPVELGLPDDFTAIQNDILTLRKTARDWLEQ